MLNIALTKGRLEKPVLAMLAKGGYTVSSMEEKNRKLIFDGDDCGNKYFLAKSADTLTYVRQGTADIAFVGSDVIAENGRGFYEILDTGLAACKFVLAKKEGEEIFKEEHRIKIGTKYPRVAREYFTGLGYDVDIIKIEGSVELAPLLGLADGIIDIMETGNTLTDNGLVVVDDLGYISTRVIVNKASFRTKYDEIRDFYLRLKEAING